MDTEIEAAGERMEGIPAAVERPKAKLGGKKGVHDVADVKRVGRHILAEPESRPTADRNTGQVGL